MKTAFEKMRQNRTKRHEAEARIEARELRQEQERITRDYWNWCMKMSKGAIEQNQKPFWYKPSTWF